MVINLPACDLSNYSGDLTQDQADCLASNVRRVILGLQDANIARQQQSMLTGRVELEYYVDRPGRDLTIPSSGSTVWLDIESGCLETRQDFESALSQVTGAGLTAGIYCNATSIANTSVLQPGETTYSYLPLWWAASPSVQWQDFNGWTTYIMRQTSPSTGLCGVGVDLDYYTDGEDTMIRFNAVANPNFWPQRSINGDQGMNAKGDFNLPDGVKSIKIEIYLISGSVQVLDGQTLDYAGQVGWGAEGSSYGIIDVNIPDGNLMFRGNCDFAQIGIVGYWT